MRRPLLALPVLAGLLLAGCTQDDFGGIRQDVKLATLQGCTELEAYVKFEAARRMNAEIDSQVRYWTRRTQGGAVAASVAAAASGGAPAAREAAQDFTTTNTQEKGVDEADFVKNDGSRIFVLHDRYLVALAAWPPGSTRTESVPRSDGHPREMFLEGNRIVVFSDLDLAKVLLRAGAMPTGPSYGFKTSVFDISGSSPALLFEQYLEGRYLGSRRIGSSLRIVSTASLRGPRLTYWPEAGVNPSNTRAMIEALERLRSQNLDLIRSSTIEDWLPRVVSVLPGELPRLQAQDCDDGFYASNAPVGFGLTTVTTLDLGRLSRGPSHTSVFAPGDTVYASADSLYVAAKHYWSPLRDPGEIQDHTYIHRFDIRSDPSRARYAASGGVPGLVLNQFSLGEHAGFLRVATTRQDWFSGGGGSDVFVLSAQGARLTPVGEVRGIAPGERIYAARFQGERGFVVTYKKVDPLFTLDLRVPQAPRIAGELKVPGFSTYIHPLGDGHLLTIGRDTIPGGANFDWFQELTLQVFDVTDLSRPGLLHKASFGSRSSSSAAEYDHKAFNYFPSRGLLAIPFTDYSASRTASFRSTLEVFRATVEGGILALGSVDHAELAKPSLYRGYPNYTPTVRRSVMMEDYVYSISYGGLKVSPMQNLTGALVTIPFPDPLPWNAPDP
jgi:uncharacterized secreted protein with C-terminal beta-propeller domain